MDLFDRLQADESVQMAQLGRSTPLWPFFRPVEAAEGADVVMEGRSRIMFGSSNFLGLAHDPRIAAAARDALDRYGSATNGSPILNGTLALHRELEEELADWLHADAAIVFPSGYNANVGTLDALLEPGDVVVCDSGAHASILDGIRLSGAELRPFRHQRINRLRAALAAVADAEGGTLVAVDSVYSMEGDVCDLPQVVAIAREHGARTYVDEAHGFGLYGPTGAGIGELLGVEQDIDLRVGTLSKAMASTGGFIVGDADVIEAIRLKARTFLFTASLSAGVTGAALAGVRIARSHEREERLGLLLANVARLREGLGELGYRVNRPSVTADGREVLTHIIEIRTGDEVRTCCLWRALYDAGVYVHAALYPSVARGRAILRLFVTAAHTPEHVERTLAAFAQAPAQADGLVEEVVTPILAAVGRDA